MCAAQTCEALRFRGAIENTCTHDPCAAASNDVGMQIEAKEPQPPKSQLVETMSSQLNTFHLHMIWFSSWLNDGFVSMLADLREGRKQNTQYCC